MLLCLACFENRLASLLDTATDLRLFEMNGDAALARGSLALPPDGCHGLPRVLAQAGVSVLVCGALTGRLLHSLRAQGLDVRPWLRGSPEEITAAWAAGNLEALAMPGCGQGACLAPGPRPCCRKHGRKHENRHQQSGKGPGKRP